MNFLEQLISEWYEYQGYHVKRNIRVGKRANGGYDGELDIVAFNHETKHLVHLEPSTDTVSWPERERRYIKKFELGKKHIPKLFNGVDLPKEIDQRAVFLLGSKSRAKIGGGDVYLVSDVMDEINGVLSRKKIANEIVHENLPLIRTLHVFIEHNIKRGQNI